MKAEAMHIAIDEILQRWAEWHQSQDVPNIGYPKRSCGFNPSGLKNWDDLCEATDNNTMQMVDSCVNSLPAPQAAAIERAYGLSAVFRFPRGNYAECLENAFAALAVGFRAKGVEL